ncbi:MAG: pentapeptide repeat-containing protein [Nitrosomonas sp.]|nr:pentapeptide repeat-containing protein [Nitrosomonas sp.]
MINKNISTGLIIKHPVSVWNKNINLRFKDLFTNLGKMAISSVVLDWKGVAENAIDLLKAAGLQDKPEQLVWVLIYQSLVRTLIDLVDEYRSIFNLDICEARLESLAQTLENALNSIEVCIDVSFFERPQDLPLLEEFKPIFIDWLKALGASENNAATIHARIKRKFVLSLHEEWLARTSDYSSIIAAIDSPFTKATKVQQSWQLYNSWLQEQINGRMFDEVFGLNQVYVPLRAYYRVSNDDRQLHSVDQKSERQDIVVDLNKNLTEWVEAFDKDDSIRIISGGPGSGKSSFSKMFASHISENTDIPVLFIPLHYIDPSADLIEAVNKFVTQDRYLIGTPLNPSDGETRLLLIFDGLDELSMQGKAAADVALNFVNEVISKLDRFNAQGLKRQALFTGRDLAVQASSQRFRKSAQILHVLPYFVAEHERNLYLDPERRLSHDQRNDWWENYARASGKAYHAMPKELKLDRLTPITKEPLLNYLVALSFEREALDFTQQTTLNEIYADLLQAVYKRQWDEERQHKGMGELTEDQFLRILEEIALAVWHGDGRTATVANIHTRFDNNNLIRYLPEFQKGAEQGVTRLLTAFYFRQSDNLQEGDKTFEFTHKSFGEYLTARRLIRMVEKIDTMFEQHSQNPDDGWDDRPALIAWAELCGATAIDSYLFDFIQNEIATYGMDKIKRYQINFARLIESAVKHGMPMEKLGLKTFQQMLHQSRNSEEALLAIHYACATKTKTKVKIDWGSDVAFGEWLKRLQGQRNDLNNKLVLNCLAYLDLSRCKLDFFDFYAANLRGTDLQDASLYNAILDKANLQETYLLRANLNEAKLIGANLQHSIFLKTSFEGANLWGANLCGANLERTFLKELF